jgi:hypothetical protein
MTSTWQPSNDRLSEPTRQLLQRMATAVALTEEKVLEIAVQRYGFVLLGGDEPDELPGGAFRKVGSDRPASVGLRQKDSKRFFLVEPFRFLASGEQVRQVPWQEPINPHAEVTDLASVPALLTWLVPRYGRHSLPALLHDDLQSRIRAGVEPGLDSRRADSIFRSALGDTRVPFFRRWMMWAGVSARTRWNTNFAWKLFLVLWVLVFGVGVGIGGPVLAVVGVPGSVLGIGAGAALVAPIPLSALWIWERTAGLIGAYTLMVIALPLVFVGAASLVYVLLELLAKVWERDNTIRTRNLPGFSGSN